MLYSCTIFPTNFVCCLEILGMAMGEKKVMNFFLFFS